MKDFFQIIIDLIAFICKIIGVIILIIVVLSLLAFGSCILYLSGFSLTSYVNDGMDKITNIVDLIINSKYFITSFVVFLCSTLLIIGVIFDFKLTKEKNRIQKDKIISKIATGRMALFFLILYFAFFYNSFFNGFLSFGENTDLVIKYIGLFITVFGTIFNIIGRIYLSNNWANQVVVYEDHKLITTGPFKYVRHPLYAGLIYFGIGVGIAYLNYIIIILMVLVFIPMMYYRASQEEKLLLKYFEEYANYQNNTGMFFPKIF